MGHIWGHLHLHMTPCVTGWTTVSCIQSFSLRCFYPWEECAPQRWTHVWLHEPSERNWSGCDMPLLRHFRNELFVYMFFLENLERDNAWGKLLLWRSCSWEEPRLPHNEQTIWVRSNFLLLWDTDDSLKSFVSLA